MHTHSYIHPFTAKTITLILAILLSLAGCEFLLPDHSGGDDDIVSFGDPYTIEVLDRLTGEPIPPSLNDSTLFVTVAYSGGCKEHIFSLNQRTTDIETLQIWLHHDSQGDLCEAYLADSLEVRHVIDIDAYSTIQLLNPAGDAFPLR